MFDIPFFYLNNVLFKYVILIYTSVQYTQHII